VVCPVEWYDPACSPMDQPVDPRDLCLQTTVWPIQGTGFPARARVPYSSRQNQSSAAQCPVKYTSRQPIDKLAPAGGPIPLPDEYNSTGVAVRITSACVDSRVLLTRRRDGNSAAQQTAKWHQSLTTVYPPGSVAVLPYDEDVKIVGEAEDYAWRLNRGHVLAFVLDVPASELYPWNVTSLDGNGSAAASPKKDILC